MFILKKGHQPGVYVPLRALFLVYLVCKEKDFTCILDVSWCSEISKTDFHFFFLSFSRY